MSQAFALMEFSNVASGILAVDAMLKKSPVALLRCGSVHPGRYLALVGGSVASAEEAHLEGCRVGCAQEALVDEIWLPAPHPQLVGAVLGERRAPEEEAVGVLEVSSSPGLLRAVDAVLKAVSVGLIETRLADDLGGRALAVIDGRLPDVQEALDRAAGELGSRTKVIGAVVLPRVDATLRDVLAAGTRFSQCRNWEPAGAETVED
jgi:microcompartment protein CcmL/EutN